MRPRSEQALGIGLIAVVGLAIGVSISRSRAAREFDLRRSSYFTTPSGARAWTDALTRLGVTVVRWRRPLLALSDSTGDIPLLALIDPAIPLTRSEGLTLQHWAARTGDLLLAGRGTRQAMRCYGWEPESLPPEGVRALGRGYHLDRVRARLVPIREPLESDSARWVDLGLARCVVPNALRVDTILATPSGSPVVLRLQPDSNTRVILVADGGLFANYALRHSDAGVLTLGLVIPDYSTVLVDERHQGFQAGGNLAGAVLEWSRRSPWGIAAWQLVVVGLLALAGGARRFGPIRDETRRKRRSGTEHVRALATALAAVRGHQVAVGLLIRGLRRRLSRAAPSGSASAWLERLGRQVRTPAAREAVRQLQTLNQTPTSPSGVLTAAHAVEDVWQDMTP